MLCCLSLGRSRKENLNRVSSPRLDDHSVRFWVPQHSCASLELGSQLPLVSLRQGGGVLREDVGEDEEELHVGEFCTRASSLPRAVGQEAFLALYHLALFQEMLRIEFIWVRPPPWVPVAGR